MYYLQARSVWAEPNHNSSTSVYLTKFSNLIGSFCPPQTGGATAVSVSDRLRLGLVALTSNGVLNEMSNGPHIAINGLLYLSDFVKPLYKEVFRRYYVLSNGEYRSKYQLLKGDFSHREISAPINITGYQLHLVAPYVVNANHFITALGIWFGPIVISWGRHRRPMATLHCLRCICRLRMSYGIPI